MLDYILGINVYSFSQFQLNLESQDPGDLHRLAAIRAAAIETCSSQLLTDREKGHFQGWTLLSPSEANTMPDRTEAYEEKVVLLTTSALFVCSYEYTLQKASVCCCTEARIVLRLETDSGVYQDSITLFNEHITWYIHPVNYEFICSRSAGKLRFCASI